MEQIMMALTGLEEEEKEEPGNTPREKFQQAWIQSDAPAARRLLPFTLRNLVVISQVRAPERFIQHF